MRLVSIVFLARVFLAPLCFAGEIGVNGWVAVGPGATVATADGALTLRYDADSAQPAVAALPARDIPLSEMKALRFEVKTDSAFAVAFVIAQKKPAGNFTAAIWSNGNEWQPVVLTLADFSPEKDGKLDFDEVENLAVTDLTRFFAGLSQNPEFYTEPHKGLHMISVRNFEMVRAPQSAWFGLSGAAFERKDDATVIRYMGRGDRWSAFTRLLPLRDLKGATHLALDVQSDRDVQLVISLGEGKSHHNVDFFVAAGKELDHREVVLSAFSDWKPDTNSIQSVTLLDVSGETWANRITIRDLRFVTR